jgi:hypothetical protein
MDELTELQIENKALRDRLKRLEMDVMKYKKIVEENDLDESEGFISDEEAICINEISKLKELSMTVGLTKDDAMILDILHKNLRLARGQSVDKKKRNAKPLDPSELFKIIEGDKK